MKLTQVVAIAAAAVLAIGIGAVVVVLTLNGRQKPPVTAAFHLLPVVEVAKPPCANGFTADKTGEECYRTLPGISNIRPEKVAAGQGQAGDWLIQVELNKQDGKAFADLTTRLFKEPEPRNRLAVVIDGKVITAPTIISPIPGGTLEISGGFTQKTATELANSLGGS
ncbi:SecDF P1 head subdomain-containing protein [Nonomuraea sp. NPDC050556]|uniref:SecDF P1 head subdomain-containing protein n=1 Tax=Nonomuraea sp. NPDC050556 TaxID=3364369 RepID=UPI0037BD200E